MTPTASPTDTSTPTPAGERITEDSPILAAPRATDVQASAFIINRGTVYSDYSVELIVSYYWDVAPQVGLDPLIAMAQCLHETDNLNSWWAQRPRRNPAGIGVTGETSSTAPPAGEEHMWAYDDTDQLWRKGLSFETWEYSARAHIGRLLAYALTDDEANDVQQALIDEALAVRGLPDSYRGTAKTLRGLTGTWATDPDYAGKVVKFANRILGIE
jgi:hypothetical protein